MHIYFSGIGGAGIGPLAEIAAEAGYLVSGSDMAPSAMTEELSKKGIKVTYGQTGKEIAVVFHQRPIDWLVVSSAIPDEGHPEVEFAKKHHMKITKRGPLLSHIIKDKHLQLIAIAGTHGKTTTTAMVVWILQQLKQEPSYSVGTNLPFGPSGKFVPGSKYFVYEADEYDRNMLDFHPYLALFPSLDYDHQDTYSSIDDYRAAFWEFIKGTGWIYAWQEELNYLGLQRAYNIYCIDDTELPRDIQVTLAGEHNRRNALLAAQAVTDLLQVPIEKTIRAVNKFPGTRRRFEKLAENIYTDYAHHPVEIRATLQLAREVADDVMVVYQPHQNLRQIALADMYRDAFYGATHVLWLPTFLTRESPDKAVLTPQELIEKLSDPTLAEPAQLNEALAETVRRAAAEGMLVLFMGAGTIDKWARDHFAPKPPEPETPAPAATPELAVPSAPQTPPDEPPQASPPAPPAQE